MPLFENVQNGVTVSVDFDVFCARCGEGICDECEKVGLTKGRKIPFVSINPCPKCLEQVREEVRKEMEDRYEQR